MLLKASGQIIAFGCGKLGQLGQGSFSSSSIPLTINPPNNGTWKQVAAGGEHSLAIFESDDKSTTQLYCPLHLPFVSSMLFLEKSITQLRRYAWGSTEYCNTADAQSNEYTRGVCSPVSKSFFHAEHSSEGMKDAAVHIVAVAAGSKHSAAVDIKGKLYMWGCNESGQCGNGACAYTASVGVVVCMIHVSSQTYLLNYLLRAGRFDHAIQPTFLAALSSFIVQACILPINFATLFAHVTCRPSVVGQNTLSPSFEEMSTICSHGA
jgi:hypothetical protein